jgi:hypothetical protein
MLMAQLNWQGQHRSKNSLHTHPPSSSSLPQEAIMPPTPLQETIKGASKNKWWFALICCISPAGQQHSIRCCFYTATTRAALHLPLAPFPPPPFPDTYMETLTAYLLGIWSLIHTVVLFLLPVM